MAPDKKKKENIITIAIVAFAVLLSGLVVLVKTGVIGPNTQSTTEPEVVYVSESTIVVKSEVDDDGNVKYYTALEWYNKPLHSSLHWYPTTTTTTEPTTEEKEHFIEETSVVEMTDEEGNPVLDENGEPVTEIRTVTIKADKEGNPITETETETTTETTSEKTTKIVYITDPISKKPLKNLRGEPITSGILTEPDVPEETGEKADDTTQSTTKPVTTKPVTTKPATEKAETAPATKKPESTRLSEENISALPQVTGGVSEE